MIRIILSEADFSLLQWQEFDLAAFDFSSSLLTLANFSANGFR